MDYTLVTAASQNPNAAKVVFKGGTSLSKAYRLTNRFSEDIDIAVIEANAFTGNQLKMLIKRLAKDMVADLEENIVKGVTSKGSRFYRALYKYPQVKGFAGFATLFRQCFGQTAYNRRKNLFRFCGFIFRRYKQGVGW